MKTLKKVIRKNEQINKQFVNKQTNKTHEKI